VPTDDKKQLFQLALRQPAFCAAMLARIRPCVALFTVSSLLCGIAPSLGMLILCRVLQGAVGADFNYAGFLYRDTAVCLTVSDGWPRDDAIVVSSFSTLTFSSSSASQTSVIILFANLIASSCDLMQPGEIMVHCSFLTFHPPLPAIIFGLSKRGNTFPSRFL